jgi:hypothetical protein
MIGAIFKLANRVASIVDRRLGELNTTITRQGEQLMNHTERGSEMISASKDTMDVLRKAVEDARQDRVRLADRFEQHCSWVQAKIGELLARKGR